MENIVHSQATSAVSEISVDLRLGAPYRRLLESQRLFAFKAGALWKIDSDDIIPTSGATGAIEALRNHILKMVGRQPSLLTVSPEYWRAKASFRALGFQLRELSTVENSFRIDELSLIAEAQTHPPHAIYLSLPNNPTGALFDAPHLIDKVSTDVVLVLDLTLPAANVSACELASSLYRDFKGRSNLFLAGSTSKSHKTAEDRIGWIICTSRQNCIELKEENKNVISTVAIDTGLRHIYQPPVAVNEIRESFRLLREAEHSGIFKIVKPPNSVEACYVLIEVKIAPEIVKDILRNSHILVMWGAEIGLSDRYMRIEMSAASNTKIFVDAIRSFAKQCS